MKNKSKKEFDFSKDDVFTKKDVEKKLGKNYYFEYNTMTYVANGDLLENKTDEEKEDIIDEAKRKIEIDLYSAEEEDVYEIIITDRTLLKEDTYY